jgi:hypothetical protein
MMAAESLTATKIGHDNELILKSRRYVTEIEIPFINKSLLNNISCEDHVLIWRTMMAAESLTAMKNNHLKSGCYITQIEIPFINKLLLNTVSVNITLLLCQTSKGLILELTYYEFYRNGGVNLNLIEQTLNYIKNEELGQYYDIRLVDSAYIDPKSFYDVWIIQFNKIHPKLILQLI